MAATKNAKGLTSEERDAARERVKELKAQAAGADGEKAVLAKLKTMPPAERALGERLHAIIRASAPVLVPRTWYGMPAYSKDDEVICFFKNKSKFKERYSTFGFNDNPNLEDGAMWPTVFAISELTPEGEAKIAALVKKAAR
jgi:uncharacterized protein YdhG (YjbR/CyaY superfamily)